MGLLTARPSSTHFVADHPLFLDVKENPDWKNQFGNSHPLKLEIGFGMGYSATKICEMENVTEYNVIECIMI